MTYEPVHGLQLYYEIRGSGKPLVLLHGGLMTIDLNFGPLLEPLDAHPGSVRPRQNEAHDRAGRARTS